MSSIVDQMTGSKASPGTVDETNDNGLNFSVLPMQGAPDNSRRNPRPKARPNKSARKRLKREIRSSTVAAMMGMSESDDVTDESIFPEDAKDFFSGEINKDVTMGGTTITTPKEPDNPYSGGEDPIDPSMILVAPDTTPKVLQALSPEQVPVSRHDTQEPARSPLRPPPGSMGKGNGSPKSAKLPDPNAVPPGPPEGGGAAMMRSPLPPAPGEGPAPARPPDEDRALEVLLGRTNESLTESAAAENSHVVDQTMASMRASTAEMILAPTGASPAGLSGMGQGVPMPDPIQGRGSEGVLNAFHRATD